MRLAGSVAVLQSVGVGLYNPFTFSRTPRILLCAIPIRVVRVRVRTSHVHVYRVGVLYRLARPSWVVAGADRIRADPLYDYVAPNARAARNTPAAPPGRDSTTLFLPAALLHVCWRWCCCMFL